MGSNVSCLIIVAMSIWTNGGDCSIEDSQKGLVAGGCIIVNEGAIHEAQQ